MEAFSSRVDVVEDEDGQAKVELSTEVESSSSGIHSLDAEDGNVERQEMDQSPDRRQPVGGRRHLYEAPEFVHRLNVFEEVELGGTVSFECQVRAFPRPVIKWYKDDVEMTFDDRDGEEGVSRRVTADDSTGRQDAEPGILRLVIGDACKDDEGAYRCKAENEEGVAATTGYLSVTGVTSTLTGRQSPRNVVSTPPLLRAITEQQSMEEREAAETQLFANDDDSQDDAFEPDPDGEWTYVDYLKAAGIDTNVEATRREAESGSDTSIEADAEPKTIVGSVAQTVQSAPPPPTVDAGPDSPSGQTADLEPEVQPNPIDVGSINVFVCENDDEEEDKKDAGGLRPLVIAPTCLPVALEQGDATAFGPEPGESDTGTSPGGDSVVASPAAALTFQPKDEEEQEKRQPAELGPSAAADDDVVGSSAGPPVAEAAPTEDAAVGEASDVSVASDEREQPGDDGSTGFPSQIPSQVLDVIKICVTAPPPEVDGDAQQQVPPPQRPPDSGADEVAREALRRKTVLQLPPADLSTLVDSYVEWFQSPWIVYVLLVVVATLLAAAYDADPASMIVGVGVASLVCFYLFPPVVGDG